MLLGHSLSSLKNHREQERFLMNREKAALVIFKKGKEDHGDYQETVSITSIPGKVM